MFAVRTAGGGCWARRVNDHDLHLVCLNLCKDNQRGVRAAGADVLLADPIADGTSLLGGVARVGRVAAGRLRWGPMARSAFTSCGASLSAACCGSTIFTCRRGMLRSSGLVLRSRHVLRARSAPPAFLQWWSGDMRVLLQGQPLEAVAVGVVGPTARGGHLHQRGGADAPHEPAGAWPRQLGRGVILGCRSTWRTSWSGPTGLRNRSRLGPPQRRRSRRLR